MEAWQIDAILYRTLKRGDQYEGLIPKPTGISHEFEKPGKYSDTFDTLRFMDEWAEKYAWQMEKVAPTLQGKTLAETVDNIYKFLYNHFQYRLDDELQTLVAPSYAWANRHKGFDCKSFSILASTILRNLNIAHGFRMVKQYGVNPGEWSHVYVIVPGKGKVHVIDATKHANKEGRYVEKYDYMSKLKHRGLAAPFTGLGCECAGRKIAFTGLGNPATLAEAVENLQVFLNILVDRGLSPITANEVRNIIRQNLAVGIDPLFPQVLALALQRTPRPFTGLGDPSVTDVASAAVNAASGNYVGAAMILKDLIPDKLFDSLFGDTFGAVFANGFNLSCWGASLTPQDAQNRIKNHYQPHFIWLVKQIEAAKDNVELTKTVNDYLLFAYKTYGYYTFRKIHQADWSSCAKKAINEVYKPYFAKIKQQADELVSQLVAKGARLTMFRPSDFKYQIPTSASGKPLYEAGSTLSLEVDVPMLDCIAVQSGAPLPRVEQILNNPDGSVTTYKPDGSTTTYNADGTIRSQTEPLPNIGGNSGGNKSGSDMGIGTMAIAAGGIAIAAMLFRPNPKTMKSPGKLGRPKTRRKATRRRRSK